MQLQKATRKKVKIKMSLASPTGFGKTYSALLLAYGITGDWTKIAVIDSENESASLYSDLGEFYTIPLAPPFTTEKYIEAIEACQKGGIECCIIDSITHVWKGSGGIIEYQGKLGGRYQDWLKATPIYQKWLDTILQSPMHMITTVRKKQAYEIVENNGKKAVEKKGMEDEIRDGYDYEMTVAFEITSDKHMAKASKDRTRLFTDKPEFVITSETGKLIKQWCEQGAEPEKPLISDTQFKQLTDRVDKGEIAAYAKAITMFRFTDEQLMVLEEKHSMAKQIKNGLPA